MNQNIELQIQRLVDGELEIVQRQKLLQTLERQSSLWRDVALAYIEDQTWRQAAREQFSGDAPFHPQDRFNHRPQLANLAASQKDHSGPARGLGTPLLLAAASLLLALLALRVMWPENSPLDRSPVAVHADRASSTPVVHREPAYKLQLGETEIPLYSQWDQLPDRSLDVGFKVEPAIQKQLINSGIVLEPDVRFLSGTMGDGRSFVVPVSGLKVKHYLQ